LTILFKTLDLPGAYWLANIGCGAQLLIKTARTLQPPADRRRGGFCFANSEPSRMINVEMSAALAARFPWISSF
jgi:hypothetical protein